MAKVFSKKANPVKRTPDVQEDEATELLPFSGDPELDNTLVTKTLKENKSRSLTADEITVTYEGKINTAVEKFRACRGR